MGLTKVATKAFIIPQRTGSICQSGTTWPRGQHHQNGGSVWNRI